MEQQDKIELVLLPPQHREEVTQEDIVRAYTAIIDILRLED